MHVALMARGGTHWLGGSQYIKNLARSFGSLPADERAGLRVTIAVTAGFDLAHFADVTGAAEVVDAGAEMAPYSAVNRVRWRVRRATGATLNPRLEDFLTARGVDFAYPARVRRDWTPGLRFAEWIPDFQYDYFPDGSNPAEIAGRKADNAVVAATLPRVVLSSGVAEADCLRLFPAAKGKTFVFRFRVSPPPPGDPAGPDAVRRAFHVPERFFLVSNLFAPTKNHAVVFDALGRLAAEGCRPTVVMTGNILDVRNPDFSSTIFHGIHRNGVNDQVRLLGVIAKSQQVDLMRQAVALIQPSLFEGWNTLVEEARCLGRPLVLSDLPVHREQAVPGARYFDPRSADDLARVLRAAWEELPAGADPAREEAARTDYALLVRDSARTFLRLARGEPA